MKLIYTFIIAVLICTPIGNNINPMTRVAAVDKTAILNDLLKKSPPSAQLYYWTKHYCKIYDIPEWFAFRILRQETGYKGPSHFNYTQKQVSTANALGSWQVLLSTGKDMHDDYFPLTRELLLTDIRLNTKLGIKYIAWLYNQYNDWYIVAGRYNSGKPRSDWPAETVRYANAVMS